jgi:methionyl-tRNA synthetase
MKWSCVVSLYRHILLYVIIEIGDIYKGTYEGWYNVREETFVTDAEAAQINYVDPTSGTPLKKMQEESYFFRMSRFQSQLIAHFEAHPTFLQPETCRQIILKRLKDEPLLDLSVSRTTFSHGIPLPRDPRHVLYVWFDALSNYLSGIDYHRSGSHARFWPAVRIYIYIYFYFYLYRSR